MPTYTFGRGLHCLGMEYICLGMEYIWAEWEGGFHMSLMHWNRVCCMSNNQLDCNRYSYSSSSTLIVSTCIPKSYIPVLYHYQCHFLCLRSGNVSWQLFVFMLQSNHSEVKTKQKWQLPFVPYDVKKSCTMKSWKEQWGVATARHIYIHEDRNGDRERQCCARNW